MSRPETTIATVITPTLPSCQRPKAKAKRVSPKSKRGSPKTSLSIGEDSIPKMTKSKRSSPKTTLLSVETKARLKGESPEATKPKPKRRAPKNGDRPRSVDRPRSIDEQRSIDGLRLVHLENIDGPSVHLTNVELSNADPSISNADPSISNVDPSISNVDPSISNADPSISNVDPSISNADPSISNADPSISVNLSSVDIRCSMDLPNGDLSRSIELAVDVPDQPDTTSNCSNVRPQKAGLQYFDFEQGSKEWISLRNKYITASAIGQIIRGDHTADYRNMLIEKASEGEYRTFFGNTATRWGHRYEPIADMIFEHRNPGVQIYEYGLIANPKYPKLAVSPDGITNMGEMLEIKCPFSRKIDGKIKSEYYAQMQQQLLVCEYEVCNFLECKFIEMSESAFWETFPQESEKSSTDKLPCHKDTGTMPCHKDTGTIPCHKDTGTMPCPERGIIIQTSLEAEKYNYYSPVDLSESPHDLRLWREYRLEEIALNGESVLNMIFWQLDLYSCQKVSRDPDWYHRYESQIDKFWSDVQTVKSEGWSQALKQGGSAPKCLLDEPIDPSFRPGICLI